MTLHPAPRTAHPVARFVSAALALLVAMAAVTALGSPAEAAPPPTLTATPNPVLVPYGQTAGTYTLTWNTGSALGADFSASINNGPWSAIFHQTPSGSGPLPINVGDTITWRMFTKNSPRIPLKSVTITARRPDQSCLENCLKDVSITPHGTFADVHVIATTVLKTFELTANKPGEAVSSAMIGANTQNWVSMLFDLEPGTEYEWDLQVRDESGNIQKKSGTFKTLTRRVTVDYSNIKVTDDSDDLSEGDLTFWFNVDGTWDPADNFGEIGMDTGDQVDPNRTLTFDGAPDIMKIGLYGYDDDCDFFDGLCSFGSAPGGSDGGSHDEADWATAWTSVLTLQSGPGESFSGTFFVSTSSYALQFDGSGTFAVTYV